MSLNPDNGEMHGFPFIIATGCNQFSTDQLEISDEKFIKKCKSDDVRSIVALDSFTNILQIDTVYKSSDLWKWKYDCKVGQKQF